MSIDGTMLGCIQLWANKRGDRPALHILGSGGEWSVTTWGQYWERVRNVGKGLMAMGVKPGQSVAMVAKNRPEWVITQHGITAAGGIPCPIYTTNLSDQIAYIVDHSESEVLFLDEPEQLEKIRQAQDGGKAKVRLIVTFDDLGLDGENIMSLADLEAKGRGTVSDEEQEAVFDQVDLETVFLRVYTSGTTGVPKGAELTNRGIRAIMRSTTKTYADVFLDGQQRNISYLPLCHAAEQIFTNFVSLEIASQTYFCPELDQLPSYLQKARPTFFLGVPRVWEKFEAALRARLGQATGVRARLAAWALSVEEAGALESARTGQASGGLPRKLAQRLVISKIKAALGLDEVRLAISGAAPISESTVRFFASVGLLIHEGYGMTETTGVATTQPFMRTRLGTVGKPPEGVEVMIGEGQEILLRGDNMVRSYHKLPEKSAELWTDDGWMRTGDMGSLDADGFLSITGRVKDLLITAGGKNVGPGEMENHLLGITGIGQAVAIGDRRPYLTALLVLDPETLPNLLQEAGISDDLSPEAAATNPDLHKYLEGEVEVRCNAKVARYQQIKYFQVLPEPFTVETGELTPTMKIKRNVVVEKYEAQIEALYEGKSAAAAAN